MSDHSQAVDLAYRCLVFLVGDEATRAEAEAALDHAPKLAVGMSFSVRNGALDMFEPQREPVPFKDYLPESFAKVSDSRAQEILDGLNKLSDWDTAWKWLQTVHEVAHTRGFLSPRSPEVELCDGTLLCWSPDVCRWEFAAMKPAEATAAGASWGEWPS